MSLHAGFAGADITPAAGLPMGGYAERHAPAEGVLDDLRCGAAVISDEPSLVVLVAIDLLWVAGPWCDALRRRIGEELGTTADHVLVAATHTHAGPAVFGAGGRDGGETLRGYERDLAATVLATVRRARETSVPVAVAFGAAASSGVAANRRHAGQSVDAMARVVAFRRADGACAGLLGVFACHPTVLSSRNLHYSRDLFGAAADIVAARVAAPVLLFNGAAADVSTRFTRRESTPAEVQRLGRLLGEAILAAEANAERSSADELDGHSIAVPVRLRAPLEVEEAEARAVAAAVAAQEAQVESAAAARVAASRLEGAMAQLYFAQIGGWGAYLGREPAAAEVQRIRIGSIEILAAPGEMFSSTARRLSRERSVLVGYANDYLGYLAGPEHAGDGEYEALMAMLEPGSCAAVERALETFHG